MRYPVVIRACYRGLPDDETGRPDPDRHAKGEWFVDGWIMAETGISEEIPVDRSVDLFEFDFTGHPERFLRGFLEGDEKHGLRVVEINVGAEETAEWSWGGGPLEPKTGKLFFRRKKKNYLVMGWEVSSTNDGTTFSLWDNFGDQIGTELVADVAEDAGDWSGESEDLVYYLPKGNALSVDLNDAGTGTGEDATATVILREVVGE